MSLPAKARLWSWRSRALRSVLYQVAAVMVIALVVWFLAHNTSVNMQRRGIQSGFDFMLSPAGFDIGEGLLAFDSEQPYWRAFLVGLLNTLRVALLGCVAASFIGVAAGIGRFSRNALVRGLCMAYVEIFRNVPLLLQLLMWYLLLTDRLPSIDQAWTLGPFYLSKGGVSFPLPLWDAGYGWMLVGLLVGLGAAWRYRCWVRGQSEQTGHVRSSAVVSVLVVVAATALGWLLGGAPQTWSLPVRGEFAIEQGGALTPEFLAVWVGLTVYTGTFIAEVVRAGIASVPRAQLEAASALGLSRRQTMRLVTLPQALRVIVAPLTNQYLNLTKNSSLAVAIGYPDVVSISNTAINQTGRALECICVLMLVYLLTSLLTSWGMSRYNARATLQTP